MNYLKIYNFYRVSGLPDESSDKNVTGDCPFCETGENHFSIATETGMFRCLKCDAGGNVFTFFKLLHEHYLAQTTKAMYSELAEARGIPGNIFKTAQLAYDADHERWIIPFYNGSKFPNNLGVCFPNMRSKYRIMKSPELPLKLYRPFDRRSLSDDIWVFEGEWDLLAAKSAFNIAAVDAPSMVSTGGATTWTKEMNAAVKGKHCTFFWDNDKGGQIDGPKAINKRISDCRHHFIQWPEYDLPIKDVRDLYTTAKARGTKQKDVVLELMEIAANTSSPPETESAPSSGFSTNMDDIEEIESYDEFESRLKDLIYTNESIIQSFNVMLATCISIKFKKDKPLWLLLIGQPSTGKSLAINAFGGTSEHFAYTSRMTSEAFISGARNSEEISLIYEVLEGPTPDLGKTLFIGDLTVIMNLPITVQEKLWGLLREAYGGTLKISFGNQAAKEFHGKTFNMIAGVTHAIYAHNDAEMGERFIKIDYVGRDFDDEAHMIRAMEIQDQGIDVDNEAKKIVLGYYKYLYNNTSTDSMPVVPPHIEEKIRKLAKLTAKIRTRVQKDRFEGMIARPVNESPTRIALQLRTLCKALMWVKQTTEVTDDIYQILKKVAFDSCPGLGLEVVLHLHKCKSASRSTLCKQLRIPNTRMHQILTDFKALDIVDYVSVNNGSGNRGRNSHDYCLSESVRECLDHLKERKFSKPPTFSKPRFSKFKSKPRKV